MTLASIVKPRWISWDSETVPKAQLPPSSPFVRITDVLFPLPNSRAANIYITPTVYTVDAPPSPAPAITSPARKIAIMIAISAPCGGRSGF